MMRAIEVSGIIYHGMEDLSRHAVSRGAFL
jgi:hypothetical protein